jgi:DNA/RNA endonuclease YhcR with UshA esterase domain
VPAPDRKEIAMKSWPAVLLVVALGILIAPASFAQKANGDVPKYDMSQEAKFKGVVDEVHERTCPISGGMGSHLMVKIDNKIYEVHVASAKFVKSYDVTFQKGDELDITGVKTTFQGVDAILPREIKRGNDDFVFRDEKGKPIW